jgi:hypothetical protein
MIFFRFVAVSQFILIHLSLGAILLNDTNQVLEVSASAKKKRRRRQRFCKIHFLFRELSLDRAVAGGAAFEQSGVALPGSGL